ncbi:VOC family protein [Rhizobium sp. KVB221]|uniref:VOC family protein n=1 Tax=Rhizobium setariae TaxID=2801340 RepID=A0A936YPZ4_9HYPH|nr:VOC family protein [Rhizobium setariae]MBL0370452.1 VOC family protein [Rhizobium setariae]
MARISTCLWFDGKGAEAAGLYTSLIPNSKILTNFGQTESGEPLVVDFELDGVPYQALNGGPLFKPSEFASIVAHTDNQAETDRLWNALTADGGAESQCGWLKDKYGVSWQIVPRALLKSLAGPDKAGAGRAMQAMMQMRKIDIAAIEAAYSGTSDSGG